VVEISEERLADLGLSTEPLPLSSHPAAYNLIRRLDGMEGAPAQGHAPRTKMMRRYPLSGTGAPPDRAPPHAADFSPFGQGVPAAAKDPTGPKTVVPDRYNLTRPGPELVAPVPNLFRSRPDIFFPA
jgi:hypothetical protein